MAQQLTVQGRVVWGHPAKLQTKKDRNKQVVIGKDGQPVQQCAFGLAIPKQMFDQQPLPSGYTIRQHLEAEARTAFPNGTPQNFAWKFKDGDGVDHMGKPFASREGFAGHYVLTISTQGFAPAIYKKDERGQWQQVAAEQVKCGDFVAVDITVKYNGSTGTNTPGLYINPNGVLFLGYGAEISSSQDPDEMFGNFQPAQFAGMSTQPMLPQGGAMPAMQPAPQPQQYAPQPQQYAPSPAQPAQLPPPARDFVQNVTGAYPQQPAAYQPTMTGQPVAGMPVQGGYAPTPASPAMAYPSNPAAPQPQQYGAPAAQPAPYGMPGQPAGR